MATDECSYEELRRKRVLENLKHLEDLGISKISKSLLEVAKSEHKQLRCQSSPRSRKKFETVEVRRSARARNQVSYRDEVDEIDLRSYRKRYCRSEQSGRGYTGRISSYEEQARAVKKAEELQSGLDPNNPSFVKSMVRSHVSSCFWLGLPSRFCKEHLPPKEVTMVLEDENGAEFDAIYIGTRTGLSGGWRGFALEHNLEDGDALVFELTEPTRFKIYIIKAIEDEVEADDEMIDDADTKQSMESMKNEEPDEQESPVSQNPPSKSGSNKRKRRR
ncbi:B3 domain-containing protein Os05g0481400 [Ananas comosus]|uniref:B3 domain-containing protein Os05g0481400 n=1 Tax=Ananas comosus TaxID=4615 RepID=A0A6P5G2V2_ANACO|nr:B3 domain-containing protein Os05g0481400 [Ananas comosus]